MSDEALGGRRRALEDAFFAQQNELLRQKMRQTDVAKLRKASLSAATGIQNDAVLDRLVALDIGPETVAALLLVPLVLVAWADGAIDERERAAVLAAARESHIGQEGHAHELLEGWLHKPPPPALYETWSAYVKAIVEPLSPELRHAMQAKVIGRAREVAEVSGGFLGIGKKVSDAEETVLARLARVFSG